MVEALESLNVPLVRVSVADDVAAAIVITDWASSVFVLVLPSLTVIVLKAVEALPRIAWLPFLLNTTALLPAVNAVELELLTQSPAILIVVAVPAENIPDESVKSPLIVSVVVLPPTLNV